MLIPEDFTFTTDGENMFYAKLENGIYHITGKKVDCHYKFEEVKEFIKTKKWVYVW